MGDHGTILRSTDGISWAPHKWDSLAYFNDVTWTGSQFVIVGEHWWDGSGSRGVILVSEDGETWEKRFAHCMWDLKHIACSQDRIIAVGERGTILSSPIDPVDISFKQKPETGYLQTSYNGSILKFILPIKSFVTLKLYDIRGRAVAAPVDRAMSSGCHTVDLKPFNLANGQYILQLKAGEKKIEKVLNFIR